MSTVFFISSCNDQSCEEVVCERNAFCNDGLCTCVAGYEKNADEICVSIIGEARKAFVGIWNVTEGCDSGTDVFKSTIVKNPLVEDQRFSRQTQVYKEKVFRS